MPDMTAILGQFKDLQLTPYELLDLSIKAQLKIIDQRPVPAHLHDDRAAALREYRTVAVAGHRQVGKTEWILRHATSQSLIILSNTLQEKVFRDRWVGLYGEDKAQPIILVDKVRNRLYRQLEDLRTQHMFDYMFVDDASHVFRHCDQKKVYAHAQHVLRFTSLCFLIG